MSFLQNQFSTTFFFTNALILPHFDYTDTIYDMASKSKLNELDILYKKVAKIAIGVEKTESSLNVYGDMKWLPLHLRYILLFICLKLLKEKAQQIL